MSKKVSKLKEKKREGIELAVFRFDADVNGDTHFTVDEGRWLRDTLDILLSSDQSNRPISFAHSIECVHNRAITLGEFHANADRLLNEYGSQSMQPSGAVNQTIM